MKAIALVVVLASVVVVCQASSDCHWGPSYWCKNKESAEECGSTQYCKDNVWKKSSPLKSMVSKPQGFECDVCKLVAEFIEKEVQSNKTEAQVKAALMDFCKSTGPLASICTDFVNSSFDKLWDYIVNKAGDEACKELGFCTSSKPAVEVPHSLKKTQVDIECTVCKDVAKELLNLVESNATEMMAKVEIKKVCVFMGGFGPECRKLIDTFFDEMWEAATKAMDPEAICKEIKLCTSSSRLALTTFTTKLKRPQDVICDTCKKVVSFMKPLVDNNNTEAEVKDALETFCKIIPGNLSTECTGFVDKYFDLVWTILKSEVDSGDACVLIKLCNSTDAVVLAKAQQEPQATVCDLCKLAVNFIKPFVDSNSTEAEVKAAVEQACSLLPGSIGAECKSLVDDYFDMIWKLLEQEVDSDQLCELIGLCQNSTITFKKKPVGGSDMCEGCQMVVKYLKGIIDNNITEAGAEALVKAACDEAGPLKGECANMVDSYFPLVWKLLQSYVDDDQICEEIKLCANMSLQSAVVEAQSAPVQEVEGGILCMVCELVMKELTSKLDTNTTEQVIQKALDEVCSDLPSSFKEDCTHFVDTYTPKIIELILSGVVGKAVCTALGLCLGDQEQLVAVQGMEECEVCKVVIGLAKTLIASKSAETKVDEVIEKICVVVPSGIREECKYFIETYGPQLIQLLDKELDPDTICADLKLCSKTTGARLTAMSH